MTAEERGTSLTYCMFLAYVRTTLSTPHTAPKKLKQNCHQKGEESI
jgi:hypothetical protein